MPTANSPSAHNRPVRTCVLIPVYNHGSTLLALIKRLKEYALPIILVDDGSDRNTREAIQEVASHYAPTEIIRLATNQGKGAAVSAGFERAWQRGFSHALQIDADGQHTPEDIPAFLAAAAQDDSALISAQPLYDRSIPKGRLYGRKITRFWVTIETWSLQITEAMCGFRLYPLAPTLAVLEKHRPGSGMEFDIDIIVRLYWAGCPIHFIPSRVTYPQKGLSHFRMLHDNARISLTHTRLCLGMLWHMPRRILRQRQHKAGTKHWSHLREKGSLWGIKVVLGTYRLLGRRVAGWLLYPIIGYFYCFASHARRASQQYLARINQYHGQQYSSFRHFMHFGEAALDKLAVWCGAVSLQDIDFPNRQLFVNQLAAGQGGVILTAHLGNIEVARALSQLSGQARIHAVVFDQHARKFNSILARVNPEQQLSLYHVQQLDAGTAVDLQEKVNQGDFVVIAADRTSPMAPRRSVRVPFLGAEAVLPQGPFILAGLLQCPLFLMLCFKEPDKRYTLVFESLQQQLVFSKSGRYQAIQDCARQYARRLEAYCRQYPCQWFNFFDFWADPDEASRQQATPRQS